MERVVSPEERIRRAEEIYYRRRAQGVRVSTSSVNVGKSNKISLGKKMIIQILVCIVIYTAFWLIKGYNNVFSENIINQTKTILSYDINFQNLYNQCMEYFNKNFNSIIKIEENTQEGNDENQNNSENQDMQNSEENVDSENQQMSDGEVSQENQQENENNTNDSPQEISEENNASQGAITDGTQKAKIDAENTTQMNEDAEYIKQNYNLIHPIEGTITSRFGDRDETEIISAFHQGIDISGVTGTPIHAAMEGIVVSASYVGGYGNHLKIQNGEVLTVYAHCSELEVKVGDYINQNQEVAKVGATGDVTGSHLHFEIRRNDRYVNPELIMNF